MSLPTLPSHRQSILLPLLGAIALALAVPGTGLSPAEIDDGLPVFDEEIAVGWVAVPVVVRSGSRYVTDLRVEDFELTVDGRAVEPETFEEGTAGPVSLVFVQDLSGSMSVGARLERSRRLVSCFLGQQRPGDEFAIISFARGRAQVDVPFTEDRPALRRIVREWQPYGATPLHDAVALLPEVVAAAANPKRAAVLLTDGADNRSIVRPGEAIRRVRLDGPPVYVFAFEDHPQRSRRPFAPQRHLGVLAILASTTGGRYFPVLDELALWRACSQIADELRHQYVLGFSTRSVGDVRDREVEVAVQRPNVEVLARQGYRGRPPAR